MNAINRYLMQGAWVLALLAGLGGSAWAQEAPEEALRAARISYVEGEVTMQRTLDEDWVEATINTPLMEGDKLYTGVGGQAEIEVDDEVDIRLGQDSFIHVEALDPARTRVGVVQGTVAFNAHQVDYARPWVAINTPSATAYIVDYANVRVEVDEDGSSEFRVRRGRIEIETGPDSIRRVERGQRLMVHEPGVFMVVPGVKEDEFDLWCDLRDAQNAASLSRQYVSSRVSGYRELDRHGEWIEVADYGRVWQPRVTVVDWAPYRHGRWSWRNRCGWVWVSNEPWGWVPYHYGRWVYVDRYRWCWVPHQVVVVRRPVWYPALVAFSYSDHGSSFRFSIGGGYYNGPCVGWFPLGPRDPYYGWYRYDIHRRHRYRRDHRDRDHRYQNQYVAHAVSVVPREDFGRNRYDRLHRGTLQLADTQNQKVKVGLLARESVEERLFSKPSEKPGDLRTYSAPRVVAPRVEKKVAMRTRPVERDAKPLSRDAKPSSPAPRAPRVDRPERPDVRSPETKPRDISVRERDVLPSPPRVERPRQDDISRYDLKPGTINRSLRTDVPAPRPARREERPSRTVPEARTALPSRPESPPVQYLPKPRTYSRPAPRRETPNVYTPPVEPEVKRPAAPSRKPQLRSLNRSSSSRSSRPSVQRQAPPRQVRQPAPASPPSSPPPRASRPAPRAPAPAPASNPAPKPAPSTRGSRGRR